MPLEKHHTVRAPRKTTAKRGGLVEPNIPPQRAPKFTGKFGTVPTPDFPAPRKTPKDHTPAGSAKPIRVAPVATRMTPRPDRKGIKP